MAKKPTKQTKKSSSKSALINPELFSTAEEVLEEEKNWCVIPWGPAVDSKTGGGILEGSLVLLQTRAKSGKSLSAMQFAVNALKQGRKVIYVDAERRLSGYKYFKINGLDVKDKNLLILRSKKAKEPLIGDDIYSLIKKMMRLPEYRGAVYIIDSFSSMVPRDTAEDKDVKASRRDTTPKLNADFLKQIGNILRTSDSVIVGIQHLSPDLNNYGALKPDGGEKFQYYSDYVLVSKHSPLNWDGEPVATSGANLNGTLIKFNLPYNKMLKPYSDKENPIMSYTKFGEGIWWGREALDLLVNEIGLVYKTSATSSWYVVCFPDGTEQKAQGAEKAVAVIEENRDIFENVIKDYFVQKYGVSYDFKPPQTTEEEAEPNDDEG